LALVFEEALTTGIPCEHKNVFYFKKTCFLNKLFVSLDVNSDDYTKNQFVGQAIRCDLICLFLFYQV